MSRPIKKSIVPRPEKPSGERLQKVLAAAGVGSRRDCEELIQQGRVEVDGEIVTELGARADTQSQEIRLDGEVVKTRSRAYYLINKPPGVISTSSDPSGRLRVIDLAPEGQRLFAVGRLDKSSQGVILATNDGELANRLTHPRYGIDKTYHVEVAGSLEPDDLATLRKGVHLAEGFARVSGIEVKRRLKRSTVLQIVLREGKNREIRRILARLGHKVVVLKRIAVGPLKLGDLPPGACRPLTTDELRRLRHAVDPSNNKQKRSRSGASKSSGGSREGNRRESPFGQSKAGAILLPDASTKRGSKSGEKKSKQKQQSSKSSRRSKRPR